MNKPSDLVQGTLDMLLLKILTLEPMIGFAVSQRQRKAMIFRSPRRPPSIVIPFRKRSSVLNMRFAPPSLQMLLLACPSSAS